MRYCESPFFYHRRKTREIVIGDPANGGVDHRRRSSGRETIHADVRHDGHGVEREANAGTRRRRLPARAHHRADGQGRGESAKHRRRIARAKLPRADCRRHPFQTRSRDGSGEMGRGRARESRQLRRLEEICDQGIHRRAIRRRTASASRKNSRRLCSKRKN